MQKILMIVDDEENVINSLKRSLRNEDYSIVTENSGIRALDKIKSGEFSINVLLSDYKMPEMTGVELLQEVKKFNPDIVRLILSGYIDTDVLIDAINSGEMYQFVTKPWNTDEIKKIINRSFDYYFTNLKNKEYMRDIIEANEKYHKDNKSRNRQLELDNEIINSLPFGLAAVSGNGEILKINISALSIAGKEMEWKDGDKIMIEDIFDSVLSAYIIDGFKHGITHEVKKFKIIDNLYSIRLRKLRKGIDTAAGIVIIHE